MNGWRAALLSFMLVGVVVLVWSVVNLIHVMLEAAP